MKNKKVQKVQGVVKNVAVSVKEGTVHAGQQLEGVATLGLAGMAEDRVSKIIGAVGAGTVLVGAVLGSKLVVFAGVGTFTYGFMRGFMKTVKTVKQEQEVYDKLVGPHGEDDEEEKQ